MGKLLLKQGRDAGAIDEFRAALRLDPDNFQILAYTAHVLAADENPQIRDGRTALVLAVKAKALTGGAQPFVLDALGMACAETGDFTNALEVTQRAIDLATAAQMKKLEPLQQRLQLYKNHQPWRESFLATNAPCKGNSEKLSHAFVNAQSIRRTRESFKTFPPAGRRPSRGNSKIRSAASKNSASIPAKNFA
jgi:tetratricopeptide (TPR) repeat protein